jgi:ABC-type uncharacterized transport system permease subunit
VALSPFSLFFYLLLFGSSHASDMRICLFTLSSQTSCFYGVPIHLAFLLF